MAGHAPPGAAPLIGAAALVEALRASAPPVVLDVSFDLADGDAGARAHRAGHIPGARYLHLEHELSGPKHAPDGRFRGRHPLPDRASFAATVGRCGIDPDTSVVIVDRQRAVMAARAWWLLRWLGHRRVSVLDGGYPAWQAAGGTLAQETTPPVPGPPYPCSAAAMPTIEADALLAGLGRWRLIDARAPERFRGEVEPLDAVAGHIPGALNRPFAANLRPDGCFKSPDQLRAEFAPLLGGGAAADIVHQCGSGVTACHNLLAMEIAGLDGGRLYPGSWSEWSSDPARPVATG